jgi:hypothetical protein
MTRTTPPPVIPAWLLRTFGSGPTIDALLGDLAEEYQRGRSATWVWVQALAAIPLSLAGELRAHPLLTLRAAALGWALFSAMSYVRRYARKYIEAAIDVYAPAHEPYMASAYRIVDGAQVWETVPISWNTFVYYPTAGLLWFSLIGLITGWCVARLHRQHRGAALLSLVATLIIISVYGSVVRSAPQPPSEDAMMVVSWFALPWARVMFAAAPIVGIVIGGLIAGSAPQHARHTAQA